MKEIREEYLGYEIVIQKPERAACKKPWVWRAEFLGAFDYADKALLAQGWHVATFEIHNMYGCDEAVELMKKFHDYVTDKYGLNQKPSIFGFSRGGLYAVNYAVKYPDDLSSMYLDAPVLDIRSWPRDCEGTEKEWEECKKWYGLDENSAQTFDKNPIDKADALIESGIPIILVAGGSDTVVPYERNGERLVEKYRERGIELPHIIKPECGHHPHSLEDPEIIVDFVKRALKDKKL